MDATDELIQRLTAERDYLRDVLELTRGQVSLLEQHKANGEKEIAKLRAEAEQFRQFESLVIGEGAWQRFQSEIVGLGTERDKLRARVAELESVLGELVTALDQTHWSSWQTTARFSSEHENARAALGESRE